MTEIILFIGLLCSLIVIAKFFYPVIRDSLIEAYEIEQNNLRELETKLKVESKLNRKAKEVYANAIEARNDWINEAEKQFRKQSIIKKTEFKNQINKLHNEYNQFIQATNFSKQVCKIDYLITSIQQDWVNNKKTVDFFILSKFK